jgi:hypothetical protein
LPRVARTALDSSIPSEETRSQKFGRVEERDHMERTMADSIEEDHGEAVARDAGLVREDFPEFDEALDPEFEPEFDVQVDPEDEKRDIHEIDAEVTR